MPTPTFKFTLAGTAGSVVITGLCDNLARTASSITPNDGYFGTACIVVTAGQMPTIQSANLMLVQRALRPKT